MRAKVKENDKKRQKNSKQHWYWNLGRSGRRRIIEKPAMMQSQSLINN